MNRNLFILLTGGKKMKTVWVILCVMYAIIFVTLMFVNIQLGETGKAIGMAITTALTVAIQTHIFWNWK